MTQHLVFLLLGLANGAVFASLALALVVTYRASGVINFATSGIALVTAYTYAYLRRGRLLVLIPGFSPTVKLTDSLGFAPALIGSLLIAALLGLLLYGLVFRPLRTAPPVARAVASLGVLVVLTGDILQRVGSNPVNVDNIFPTHAWHIGHVRVSEDRVWFAVTVVIVALALAAAYRFTRFGLHTRAAAETEKGAYLSGISPDRIALLNWMISAAVAGLAGVLIAPIVPLSPAAYSLFIVPALAAAITGRFQGMAIAVGIGLLIGMLQSECAYLQSKYSWLPSSGLPEMVPLVLILAVLIWRTQPLPGRGELIRHSLGRAPRPGNVMVPTVVATVAAVVALMSLHGVWRSALVTSLIFGIISLSLVVVTGFAGQVSLAQLVLAGVAAFLLSPLTVSWGVPFPIAPLLAALGATVVGVVVGLPAARIRGLPLAVVTLALAVALEAFWFQNTDFVSSSGKPISGPTLFGLNLRVGNGSSFPRLSFCFLVLVTLVAMGLVVAKIRTSRLGSAMLAVRANERSAAASGINVVRTKLVAFAIASFIAGIGGALLAYQQTNVTFDPFDAVLGLSLFAIAYLAGITSVSGGIARRNAGVQWHRLPVLRQGASSGRLVHGRDGRPARLHRGAEPGGHRRPPARQAARRVAEAARSVVPWATTGRTRRGARPSRPAATATDEIVLSLRRHLARLRRRRPPSTTCPSTSTAARSSASSARTVRARPPSSTPSAASPRTRGMSWSPRPVARRTAALAAGAGGAGPHLPGHRALGRPERAGEHHRRHDGGGATGPSGRRWSGSSACWACPRCGTARRPSSPRASASWSPSPAPWSAGPRCCCSTSPAADWTPPRAAGSASGCATCATAASPSCIVDHDMQPRAQPLRPDPGAQLRPADRLGARPRRSGPTARSPTPTSGSTHAAPVEASS